MSLSWYVYLVRCADSTLYCGVTTDPKRRLKEHNTSKLGAAYTKARRPVQLVYLEKIPDRSLAQKREAFIKALPKTEKEKLVLGKIIEK